MRSTQFSSVLVAALMLQSQVSAYPFPFNLLGRQAGKSTTAAGSVSVSASPANTAGSSSPAETGASRSSDSPSRTSSDSNSGSKSATATTARKSGTSASMTLVTHSVINPVLPAGGVAMQTPAVSDGSQYYKIGDYVTFGWNYTSLLVSPTAVNIQVYCSASAQYYDVASNVSIDDGTVVWNTSQYIENRQIPFIQALYTLVIFDESNPGQATAAASAGYLEPYDRYSFAMYSPQPYTPLSSGFQCAVCSGASDLAVVKMILGLGLITSLSFTWFLCGAL